MSCKFPNNPASNSNVKNGPRKKQNLPRSSLGYQTTTQFLLNYGKLHRNQLSLLISGLGSCLGYGLLFIYHELIRSKCDDHCSCKKCSANDEHMGWFGKEVSR